MILLLLAWGGALLSVGGEFDGIGLLAFGLHCAGLRHAWLCEVDEWRRSVLAQRFPGVLVYPDIRAVDARAARVDIIAGGFPCKGASTAGRREGFGHPETVLWREMARTVRDLRPAYVLVENVANILAIHDGAVWGEVVGDLASLGFDIEWDCIPAGAFGAPHLRDRVIAIASHPERVGRPERAGLCAGGPGGERRGRPDDIHGEAAADTDPGRGGARPCEPVDVRQPQARGDAADASDAVREGLEGRGVRRAAPDRAGASPDDPWGREGGTAQETRADRERAGPRANPAPDPGGAGVREQPVPEPRGDAPPVVAESRGVNVEWGAYEPAIRRWEKVHGPAPEPLVRRVDARASSRVERSRLSALGDGVQVHLGELAGRRILELEKRGGA